MISTEQMQEVMKYRSEHNHFGNEVGITVTKYREGYAKGYMDIRQDHLNPLNTVHGGCLYTLADTIGGNASATYGTITPTVSGDLHFIRAATAEMGRIWCEAQVIHHGRTLAEYQVSILGPDEKTLLATGIFTYFNKGISILPEEEQASEGE